MQNKSTIVKESTPQTEAEDKQTPKNRLDSAIEAPLNSRAIAAFIDYLVLQAVLIPTAAALSSSDYLFLLASTVSILYFGIGNSHITSGNTLGKKAFGLFVINSKNSQPLSLNQSLVRCLFQIVFPVLIIELPSLYYRHNSITGPAYLLEMQMLFVIVYTLWNASLVLVAKNRQAGHDLFANSIVLQKSISTNKSPWQNSTTARKFIYPTQFAISIFIGAILWWFSVSQMPQVEAIHRIRYSLEHDFPVRVVSIQGAKDVVLLQLIRTTTSKELSSKVLADSICKRLKTSNSLVPELQTLKIELLAADKEQVKDSSRLQEFGLSPQNCLIIEENN